MPQKACVQDKTKSRVRYAHQLDSLLRLRGSLNFGSFLLESALYYV